MMTLGEALEELNKLQEDDLRIASLEPKYKPDDIVEFSDAYIEIEDANGNYICPGQNGGFFAAKIELANQLAACNLQAIDIRRGNPHANEFIEFTARGRLADVMNFLNKYADRDYTIRDAERYCGLKKVNSLKESVLPPNLANLDRDQSYLLLALAEMTGGVANKKVSVYRLLRQAGWDDAIRWSWGILRELEAKDLIWIYPDDDGPNKDKCALCRDITAVQINELQKLYDLANS